MLALEYEGYCVRTVEEDETAGVEEPLLAKKDDKKKGKKGKWGERQQTGQDQANK